MWDRVHSGGNALGRQNRPAQQGKICRVVLSNPCRCRVSPREDFHSRREVADKSSRTFLIREGARTFVNDLRILKF